MPSVISSPAGSTRLIPKVGHQGTVRDRRQLAALLRSKGDFPKVTETV